MNRALICVDVQPDFLPGGPLGVPNGHTVVPVLIDLMNDADVIVLTRDWHPANHVSFSTTPEFKDGSWPMHCVQHTEGADFDDELFEAAFDSGKPVLFVNKGMDPTKEAYSGFDGVVVQTVGLDDMRYLIGGTLSRALLDLSVSKVVVGGLALDYCVKATAIDAARDRPTTVVVQATAAVDPLGAIESVVDMGKNGVRIDTRYGS